MNIPASIRTTGPADRRLTIVNRGAILAQMIESELFGRGVSGTATIPMDTWGARHRRRIFWTR